MRTTPSSGRLPRAAVTALLALLATPGQAQRAGGYIEWIAAASDARTRGAAVQPSDRQSLGMLQRYSFDASTTLFPNLLLSAGGLYEHNQTEGRGAEAQPDTTQERLRSYVSLVFRTPVYFADAGFYRLEDTLDAADSSQGDVRESLNLTLGWRPEDLPVWTARLLHTDIYDKARELRDLSESLFDLTGEYAPIDTVRLYYRGGLRQEENRLEGTDLRFTTHAGRLSYADSWLERRLQLSFEYNGNYLKREILRAGEGEVVTPRPALTGLSVVTEFPLDSVLEPNPALTDGDTAASAGINLGLPGPGQDDRPRNLGLDFGVETAVDTLVVRVDRELPPEISSAFRWQLYTSSDNRLWQLRETVARVRFGPLENRFELRFGELSARYLKIVTAPLDRSVQRAEEFPLILVTELEAFERTRADELLDEPGITTHRFSGSLRTKLLANRSLYHDLSYFRIDPEDRTASESLSNALSFSQRLSPVFSFATRAAREDGSEGDREFVSYPFSAALRASWLPTLRQSLVVSGTRTEEEGGTREFRSVFLQTSAELYQGVTAELGLGRSRSENPEVGRIDSTQVTASTTLVPHPTVSVNLTYLLRESERRDGPRRAAVSSDLTASEIGIGYRPFPALYLFGSYRLEEQPGRPDRTRENYNLSWSPFPDGSLQLTLTYDETLRSELDALARNLSASARWNVTPSRYLQLSYFQSDFGSTFEDRQQESVQGSLRFTF